MLIPKIRFEKWLAEIRDAFSGAVGVLQSKNRFERWLAEIRDAAYEAGQGGSSISLTSVEVDHAGTITPPEGYAYNEVNVPGGSFTINPDVHQDGVEWKLTADIDTLDYREGYTNTLDITINDIPFVPTDYVNFGTLIATDNSRIYYPSEYGLDGFSSVSVEVPDRMSANAIRPDYDYNPNLGSRYISDQECQSGSLVDIQAFGMYNSSLDALRLRQEIADYTLYLIDDGSGISLEFTTFSDTTYNRVGLQCIIPIEDPDYNSKVALANLLVGEYIYLII